MISSNEMSMMQSFFSLQTQFTPLFGFAFRLASSIDGPWNDQVHKILRTNYPVEPQVLFPQQESQD